MNPLARRVITEDCESWYVVAGLGDADILDNQPLTVAIQADSADALLTALTAVTLEPERCHEPGCQRFAEDGFGDCKLCLASQDLADDWAIAEDRGA